MDRRRKQRGPQGDRRGSHEILQEHARVRFDLPLHVRRHHLLELLEHLWDARFLQQLVQVGGDVSDGFERFGEDGAEAVDDGGGDCGDEGGVGGFGDESFDQVGRIGFGGEDDGGWDEFFEGGDVEGLELGVAGGGGDEVVDFLDDGFFLRVDIVSGKV